MNEILTNLHALLAAADGRTVIFGAPSAGAAGTVVAVSAGESEEAAAYFGADRGTPRGTLNVAVYADGYADGLALIGQIGAEIAAQEKTVVKVAHKKDDASYYDKDLNKHVFRSHYTILN